MSHTRAPQEALYVVGRVVGDLTGESIQHHTNPDRSWSGIDCPIHDGFDECDVVVVEVCLVLLVLFALHVLHVLFTLHLLLVLFALHVLLIVALLSPGEADQVNRRELNASLV